MYHQIKIDYKNPKDKKKYQLDDNGVISHQNLFINEKSSYKDYLTTFYYQSSEMSLEEHKRDIFDYSIIDNKYDFVISSYVKKAKGYDDIKIELFSVNEICLCGHINKEDIVINVGDVIKHPNGNCLIVNTSNSNIDKKLIYYHIKELNSNQDNGVILYDVKNCIYKISLDCFTDRYYNLNEYYSFECFIPEKIT